MQVRLLSGTMIDCRRTRRHGAGFCEPGARMNACRRHGIARPNAARRKFVASLSVVAVCAAASISGNRSWLLHAHDDNGPHAHAVPSQHPPRSSTSVRDHTHHHGVHAHAGHSNPADDVATPTADGSPVNAPTDDPSAIVVEPIPPVVVRHGRPLDLASSAPCDSTFAGHAPDPRPGVDDTCRGRVHFSRRAPPATTGRRLQDLLLSNHALLI